jgi:hypothetical protein
MGPPKSDPLKLYYTPQRVAGGRARVSREERAKLGPPGPSRQSKRVAV